MHTIRPLVYIDRLYMYRYIYAGHHKCTCACTPKVVCVCVCGSARARGVCLSRRCLWPSTWRFSIPPTRYLACTRRFACSASDRFHRMGSLLPLELSGEWEHIKSHRLEAKAAQLRPDQKRRRPNRMCNCTLVFDEVTKV